MRLVIQKVDKCTVLKNKIKVTNIQNGFVFYIGVDKRDTEDTILKGVQFIIEFVENEFEDEKIINELEDENFENEFVEDKSENINSCFNKSNLQYKDTIKNNSQYKNSISNIIRPNLQKLNLQKLNLQKPNILLLSQFTLFATYKKKNPSFHTAMENKKAFKIFNEMTELIKQKLYKFNVQKGLFGEELEICYVSSDLKTFYYEIL